VKVRRFLAAVAAGLLLDQLTKLVASNCFSPPPPGAHGPAVIPGLLYITLRDNPGISFGALRGVPPWVLIAGNIVIVGLLFYYYFVSEHGESTRFDDLALAAIVGGATGNIIDRLWAGVVLDFIDVYVSAIGFDYPVFNVADILIVLGVGYMLVTCFRKPAAGKDKAPGK